MKQGETIQIAPGEKMTCLRSSSSGGRFEFEVELGPGVEGPPTHHHAEGPEVCEIVSGSIIFWLDGKKRVLRAGDRLEIPAGVPHTFRNASKTEPALARGGHGPRFERAVDQHAGGGPAFSRLARFLTEVDPGASYMVNPLVRAVLRVLAFVARVRGVQLRDPQGELSSRT